MIATVHVVFDRKYFEMQYDDWLLHRSRFKKYEVWFAVALIAFGLIMAFTFQRRWLLGALFAFAGAYEFIKAVTSKRRWVNDLMSTSGPEKTVDLEFDGDTMYSKSPNGSGTMKLEGFLGFALGTNGFFLIPDTGVSIYVPRAAFDSHDSYCKLVDLLSSKID